MRLDELIEGLQEMLKATQADSVQVEVNTDLGRTKVDVDHLEYDGAGGVVIIT